MNKETRDKKAAEGMRQAVTIVGDLIREGVWTSFSIGFYIKGDDERKFELSLRELDDVKTEAEELLDHKN